MAFLLENSNVNLVIHASIVMMIIIFTTHIILVSIRGYLEVCIHFHNIELNFVDRV
jgi:hypothetical protein